MIGFSAAKKWTAIAVLSLGFGVAASLPLYGANDDMGLGKMFDLGIKMPTKNSRDLYHARADHWRMVGNTVFVKGHVYIPYDNLVITADEAMLDLESRDLEVKGNIKLFQVRKQTQIVTSDELERLLNVPELVVTVKGYTFDPLGNEKIQVEVQSPGTQISADRLAGNFATGYVQLNNLEMELSGAVCRAAYGLRQPGGEIKLEDAELSTCNYISDHQGHYSVKFKRANLYPHRTEGFGFSGAEADKGEYSVWGYNTTLNIYDIPVLWLPFFYKPKDESLGIAQTQIGETGRWGYYLLASKVFYLSDYPSTRAVFHLDWYGLRGVGYGAKFNINSASSKTEINAYNIYDIRPYEGQSWKYDRKNDWHRLEIPHERYDFRITNMTHLAPRLDFRGQFEILSDAYFLRDYFRSRADTISEPASYAALEFQANRYSASVYSRVQVNDFFTTVEKLPELRLDVPRQEILPGTNLYYQGSHTADYLSMKWPEFDRKLKNPLSKLDDYSAGRVDSVNFLYYPLRLGFLNVVPRAGMRMTGYTQSSEHRVTSEEVYMMQVAANRENDYGYAVNNYDDDGGSRFRVIWELGVEANTKIYRSWQNVRNTFWRLDGMRHVMEPYLNYTYIGKPSVSRDYLYFFDDIDRIDKQNFVRLGFRNRLQTRGGGFNGGTIREWLELENYWDIFLERNGWESNIGDFVTKLTFSPSEKLRFSGFFSIDAGQNNEHDLEARRGNRYAGRPGISGKVFNRVYFQMQYAPIEDIVFNLSYNYKDSYISRSTYSMGSTLTEIESGSAFDQYYVMGRSQTVNFGFRMPITPDRKTKLAYSIAYDMEEGGFSEQSVAISRTFHCAEVVLSLSQERERKQGNGYMHTPSTDNSISVMVYLVGLKDPMTQVQRSAVNSFTNMD